MRKGGGGLCYPKSFVRLSEQEGKPTPTLRNIEEEKKTDALVPSSAREKAGRVILNLNRRQKGKGQEKRT